MNRTVSPNVKFSQLSTVTTKVLPPNLSTVLTISSSQKLSYSPVLKYANNSGISSNIIGVLPRNYPTTYFVFFGDDFVQTATQIKIQKSALLGLTLTNNNRAESLFVGLLARLINYTASDTVGNVTANLWGVNFTENKRITTIEIDLYNQLSLTNGYETPDLTTTVTPGSY